MFPSADQQSLILLCFLSDLDLHKSVALVFVRSSLMKNKGSCGSPSEAFNEVPSSESCGVPVLDWTVTDLGFN